MFHICGLSYLFGNPPLKFSNNAANVLKITLDALNDIYNVLALTINITFYGPHQGTITVFEYSCFFERIYTSDNYKVYL